MPTTGALVEPGFVLDIEQLRLSFDSVHDLGWNALGLHFPEGPHLYIEGVFHGHALYLEILAHPPEDEEPGLKLDATRPRP